MSTVPEERARARARKQPATSDFGMLYLGDAVTVTHTRRPTSLLRLAAPPLSSPLACWHCTDTFECAPHFLIESVLPWGALAVRGNFCSDGCVARYEIDHDVPRAKRALRIRMRREYCRIPFSQPLAVAPDRECLLKFGGTMSRTTFNRIAGRGDVLLRDRVSAHVVLPPYVFGVEVDQVERYPGVETDGTDADDNMRTRIWAASTTIDDWKNNPDAPKSRRRAARVVPRAMRSCVLTGGIRGDPRGDGAGASERKEDGASGESDTDGDGDGDGDGDSDSDATAAVDAVRAQQRSGTSLLEQIAREVMSSQTTQRPQHDVTLNPERGSATRSEAALSDPASTPSLADIVAAGRVCRVTVRNEHGR